VVGLPENGRGGVVRLLLESGADPTAADNEGNTPAATARRKLGGGDPPGDPREWCVAALEVSLCLLPLAPACLVS
jgi:hypothetical protein